MPAAAAATPEIPAVPPVDPQDDYGDFLALLEDGSAPGEAPPGAPDAAPAPAKPAPAGEGDDLFAPPPAGAEPVVPAPAPAPSDKSLLDITTRLAALQEAENARRAEEAEARRRKEKEEADRLREAEEARPMFEGDLSLTPEESEAYRDAMPVLQKVARSVAEDMYRRAVMPLRKEIETLRLQSSGLQSTVQRSQAEGFAAALRGAVPDLDQRVADPAWQAYLAEPVSVPGAGRIQRAQAIQMATSSNDLAYVVEQLQAFKQRPAARRPSAVSPGEGPAAAPSAHPVAPARKLRYSEAVARLTDMSDRVRRGVLPLEKYEAAMTQFETAVTDGRVDMDA